MSISIFMIALGPNTKPSPALIAADFASQWLDQPRIEALETKDDTFSFRVGTMDVIGATMPAPIPWGDLEGPIATSWLWRDAEAALRQHTTHLILTVMGDTTPLERIRLLTRVTASLLATCPEAVGVYVGEAGLVVQAPVFHDFATTMTADDMPLYIWIDFRAGTLPNGKTYGFTAGLESFGHREFEIPETREGLGAVRERLFSLADYVLTNGAVIRDGDTVGGDALEKIRVTFADSVFGHKKQVIRLNFESTSAAKPAPAKKPWWKPFSG